MSSSALVMKLTIQAGSEIVKHRSPIIDYISNKSKGFISTDVVVTGTPGVGKSIFIGNIDSFIKEKYPVKPDLSNDIEINIIRVNDDFLPKKVVVIPGQSGSEQNNAFRKLIINNEKLSGIIHVVDFGCTKPRSDMSEMHYTSIGIDTLEKLRLYFIDEEILYFNNLVSMIKSSKNKIKWLHIVINKIDLFSQQLEQAVNHYHENEFGSIVKELCNHIGSDFKVSYSFAISSRDNLTFNNESRTSIVDNKMNENLLREGFISELAKNFK